MSAVRKARRSNDQGPLQEAPIAQSPSSHHARHASAPVDLPLGKHIYAQVIDDLQAVTVASASTNEKDGKEAKSWNVDAASSVGKKIAERAKAAGVTQVMFDRGGYIYHGRIKALADAARAGGLEF